MSSGEERKARGLLQEFVKDSIPEYIMDGAQLIVANGGVQKLGLKKGEGFWEVEGNVQGDDFQIYSPEVSISLSGNSVNANCNCPESFSGICRHIGATALKLLNSLESSSEEEGAPPALKTEWRQSFRSFFSTELEPEPGKHYFIFRFHPEPGRLQVAFFRARQNKSGLSTVQNEITLEQVITNPDWSEVSPELPLVAEQIAHYIDYSGHRVDIPDGLVSWFFWTIQHEYYLFWEDTEQPCRIFSKTMRLLLAPELTEAGLTFDVLLAREGKPPFSIKESTARAAEKDIADSALSLNDEENEGEDEGEGPGLMPADDATSAAAPATAPALDVEPVSFFGHLPLWVCWERAFYPVQTALPTKLIRELTQDPPTIPKGEISEFLDRVWTRLPASALYNQEALLDSVSSIFADATYQPKLFLDEEGSLLTLEIQNTYETEHGEIALPGPNPELQTGSYSAEGASYLIRREQDEEAALTATLQDMGFKPRSNSIWFLEPEEAIAFLLDAYPQLVERYRVYGEKNLTRYKVRATQPVIQAEVESKEDDKWFNLELSVEYDGQRVPIEKIWKAWTQGKRYVQLKDGTYTSLPESWLQRLSGTLRALGYDPEKPPQQTFKQFEAPALDKILEDVPEATTDSFWNTLRTKIHSFKEITPVPQPEGLRATLRPYQLQGLGFLNFLREYGFGGILADEMGLGKTIQTLSFLQHMVDNGATAPNLIVVPTSVLPNWDREAEKFVPELKRLVIYGTRREAMFKQISDSHLVITTYALMRRDLEELQKHEFNAVILDEAQNIKNPNTITARSVRKLASKLRICLSGTPIENNLFELWSLFEFLMPGFLGSQHSFQRGIVKPIKDGDEDTLTYLRTRVKPFILRRAKSEVAKDLPPKIENVYYCALIEEQMELYAALAKKLRDQVLRDVDEKGLAKSQLSILDALLKLRQICCHPRLLKLDMPGVNTNLPSGKFDAFKDMVTDIIEEGHKVLVFSQFVSMLHIIRSWLTISKIPFSYLDGTSKDRFDQVDEFNNTPEIPIFLISLKAGGTGLNLTSADYVIHYDPWWNPAVESQATDRTHRIGQTRQVFSYKLICQNTVEEKILKLQEAKRGVAEAIIPGQDAWKSLSRSDLEMLFDI